MVEPELARALVAVGAAMREARDPWWLIGSAAMALHGIRVSVADIDLMASVADADRLFASCVRPGLASDLFRSARHGGWDAAGYSVDLMAGLEICKAGHWHAVEPRASETVRIGEVDLFTPGPSGLLSLCRLFDRPKDRARAVLLEALA